MTDPTKVNLEKADVSWLERLRRTEVASHRYTWFSSRNFSPTLTDCVGLLMETDGSLWYFEVTGSDALPTNDKLTNPEEDWPLTGFDITYQLMDSGCVEFIGLQDPFFSDSLSWSAVFFLREDGTLWKWAYPKTFGETLTARPQKILDNVVSIQGEGVCYALDKDGALWDCVGETPLRVIGNIGKYIISGVTMAAIKTDGSLWTWDRRNEPKHRLDNVVDVQTDDYTIALKADGSLWAWGGGHYFGSSEMLFPIPENETERNTPRMIMDNIAIPGTPANVTSPWAIEEVSLAKEAGLVPTNLQSLYQSNMTRAEFCALAVALYEKMTGQEIAGRISFTDTNDINVEKMAAVGVVNGTSPGKFTPNGNLTREQAATMLARLASAIDKPFPKTSATFDDKGTISDWALEAVGQVQGAGIMNGASPDKFSPKGVYTREQSIATMLRMYDTMK